MSGPNSGDETVDFKLMIYWDETLGSLGKESMQFGRRRI